MPDPVFSSWGRALAAKRRELGLTQAEVARSLDLDAQTISRAERGIGGFHTYRRAAERLDVNLYAEVAS